MSTLFFDIFKNIFADIFQTNVRLFYIQLHPVLMDIRTDQARQTYVRLSVKWEKTDFSKVGGTKNQNICSIFPVAYKLVHLHTNFILKHLNKNPTKPSKIKRFTHFNPKILISYLIS